MAKMKLSSCILVLFSVFRNLTAVDFNNLITAQSIAFLPCRTKTLKPIETTTNIVTNTTPNVVNTTPNVVSTTSNDVNPTSNPEVTTISKFVAEVDVEFVLRTRLGRTILKYHDESTLQISNFNKNKPVKVLAHGFFNSGGSPFNLLIAQAFLKSQDLNVIIVDWSLGSNVEYQSAVENVAKTGIHLANLIDWLKNTTGVPISSFHLIGHDLGAHLVGIAGRNVKSGQVSYITALDPSKVLWDNNNQSIGSKDAQYVEVIHTSIIRSGLEFPLGHADFYPNKGFTQPGCKLIDIACSHDRAYEFFADSIDHKGFMADQCTDYTEMADEKCAKLSKMYMGGSSPKLASGVFYLETNDQKPFYNISMEE